LTNTAFDAAAGPWAPEYGATAAFAANRDARGSATSGALGVANTLVADADGIVMTGARQCVSAKPGGLYALAADVFLLAGQPAASAGIHVQFFDSQSCLGPLDGAYLSTLVTTGDAWTSIGGSLTVPEFAHSMVVRLVVQKTFRAGAAQAFFDNLSLVGQ
jgi:hypothetical protein